MSEVLDCCFHLVVSEEVDGEPDWVEFLLKVGLERVHDQSDLQVGVGSEDLSGVDFFHFQTPVVEDDHFLFQIHDGHVGVLLLELRNGVLCEVGLHEEVLISDEEVRVSFFDEALDGLLEVGADLGEVSSLVEHLGVELFESALVASFAHCLVD